MRHKSHPFFHLAWAFLSPVIQLASPSRVLLPGAAQHQDLLDKIEPEEGPVRT